MGKIMSTYAPLYDQSMTDPDTFWSEAASELDWYKPFDSVLNTDAKPVPTWFDGGELNTCFNALDRHVAAGHGDRLALIYDSPITDSKASYTYLELTDQVARFAGVLQAKGVEKGDRVLIYMPMIPQAAIAMLACARLGAIHSVVFGGFASNELATRINDAAPKVIVSASCGIEPNRVIEYKPLLDNAIEVSEHKPSSCIIFAREQAEATLIPGRDSDWEFDLSRAKPVGALSRHG